MDPSLNITLYCKTLGNLGTIACPKNYICCSTWGCCVAIPSSFHFYQLWYYWLLVIILFILITVGGWWYRAWLATRFPGHEMQRYVTRPESRATTLHPPDIPLTRTPGRRCIEISYDPERRQLTLQRVFKVCRNTRVPCGTFAACGSFTPCTSYMPGMRLPPPPYTVSADNEADGAATSTLIHGECPYYQCIGPPPTYDSVVGHGHFGSLSDFDEVCYQSMTHPCQAHQHISHSSAMGMASTSTYHMTSQASQPPHGNGGPSTSHAGANFTSDYFTPEETLTVETDDSHIK